MNYRKAEEKDIDSICRLIKDAITEMERSRIFQWDEVYPAENDFLSDIRKGDLYVGEINHQIAVVFAINHESDEQYRNGDWKYPGNDYRIIHRLCVDPQYQNQGVARKTLSHIEGTLKGKGVEAIRLDVFCENPYALSLYRKADYQEASYANWRKGRFLLMEKHL